VTIFSLQRIFSRSILPILKKFQVLKTSFNSFFSFTVFHFEKSQNSQLCFSFSVLSANRNLENKVGNMIQHIKNPSPVKKSRKSSSKADLVTVSDQLSATLYPRFSAAG